MQLKYVIKNMPDLHLCRYGCILGTGNSLINYLKISTGT